MCLISFSKSDDYSSKLKLDRFDGNPLWAYINITSQCSHKCRWCYGGFNGNLTDMMSLGAFETILEKLADMKVLQVSLSGGEPTEHPQFRQFLEATHRYGFLSHIVTHGGTLAELAPVLAAHGVKQVQVNYQGKELHDEQHGVAGAYQTQYRGLAIALRENIEVTATITVGEYNLARIPEIFHELSEAGLDRFRVWESTGRGNAWRKGIEAVQIFEYCQAEAAKLGYTFVQSYDPAFTGDTGIRCPPMSGLHLHINTNAKLRFCPAVLKGADLADFLTDSPDDIIEKHRANNMRLLALNDGVPWCVARGDQNAESA